MTEQEYQEFLSWFKASKYCQVVIPREGWYQLAMDAFMAGKGDLPESLRDPMKVLERGRVLNIGIMGVSRVVGERNVLRVICRKEPTDDEIRAFHDHNTLWLRPDPNAGGSTK